MTRITLSALLLLTTAACVPLQAIDLAGNMALRTVEYAPDIHQRVVEREADCQDPRSESNCR